MEAARGLEVILPVGSELAPPVCGPKKLTDAAAGAALVEDLSVAALSVVVENTELGATPKGVAGVAVTLDPTPPNGCANKEAALVEKLNAPDAAVALSPPLLQK